ncbi:MAG: hypothetical protein JWR42_2918 [Marmoricola sp.]|nr:hypothetical protein [Marmoricola sp.]
MILGVRDPGPVRLGAPWDPGEVNRSRAWILPLVADLVCVLVFAIAGKGSHEAGASEWVVLAIVWPFAVGVLAAHAALLARGRSVRPVWPAGVAVLAAAYVVGMVLRVVSGRGIAVGFLVVAAIFLAVTLLGWRALADLVARRRSGSRAQVGTDSPAR